jgi:hypothetical protein
MSITVAELVALPHLGLEVVAGLAGLAREVGWAHVCELEDPPPLTPSFLRSAEKLGFPVVAVSIEVPFVAIARIVVYGEQRRIIAPARPADCRFRCAAGQHGAVRPARAVPPA